MTGERRDHLVVTPAGIRPMTLAEREAIHELFDPGRRTPSGEAPSHPLPRVRRGLLAVGALLIVTGLAVAIEVVLYLATRP